MATNGTSVAHPKTPILATNVYSTQHVKKVSPKEATPMMMGVVIVVRVVMDALASINMTFMNRITREEEPKRPVKNVATNGTLVVPQMTLTLATNVYSTQRMKKDFLTSKILMMKGVKIVAVELPVTDDVDRIIVEVVLNAARIKS